LFLAFVILNWIGWGLVVVAYVMTISSINEAAEMLGPTWAAQEHGAWIGGILGLSFYCWAWGHVHHRLRSADRRFLNIETKMSRLLDSHVENPELVVMPTVRGDQRGE